MAIPFSPPDLSEEDIEAVVKVLRSGWITSGPVCREFEDALVTFTDDDLLWEIKDTSGEPVERLKAAVRAVTAGRATVPPPEDRSADDVVDPYRRSDATYALSTEQIVPAVTAILAFLSRALEVEL